MPTSKKSISVLKNIFRSLERGSSRNQACRAVNIEYKTLWQWMNKDSRLKAKIEDLSSDKRRLAVVEDVCYHRLLTESASPVEYIFYLKNRAPDRWNNNGKVAPETLQIVLNKILFIISDTVKDTNLKSQIADRLAELSRDSNVVDMQSSTRLVMQVCASGPATGGINTPVNQDKDEDDVGEGDGVAVDFAEAQQLEKAGCVSVDITNLNRKQHVQDAIDSAVRKAEKVVGADWV
jgi:hypothetical protein